MYYVSGDGDLMDGELASDHFMIGGRIVKEDVWKYVEAVKSSFFGADFLKQFEKILSFFVVDLSTPFPSCTLNKSAS